MARKSSCLLTRLRAMVHEVDKTQEWIRDVEAAQAAGQVHPDLVLPRVRDYAITTCDTTISTDDIVD